MDLDGDGCTDILSGSYSRQGSESMAGLFQVLRGTKDGKFRAASALTGGDGQALVLPEGEGEDDVVDRICTRPFAADLDADGKLDLVSGNFRGTFGFFAGQGQGKFSPRSTWLEADGERMAVSAHGDPFLVDWDGDGDLDLLSGSGGGGAFLFPNVGSKQAARFGAQKTLLEPAGHAREDRLGDALTKPGSDTRIWADDVDGDGKLDLLIGDNVTLTFPAKGVGEETAQRRLGEWNEEQKALFETMQEQPSDEEQEKFDAAYEALQEERKTFVLDERTGFVWLLIRK